MDQSPSGHISPPSLLKQGLKIQTSLDEPLCPSLHRTPHVRFEAVVSLLHTHSQKGHCFPCARADKQNWEKRKAETWGESNQEKQDDINHQHRSIVSIPLSNQDKIHPNLVNPPGCVLNPNQAHSVPLSPAKGFGCSQLTTCTSTFRMKT